MKNKIIIKRASDNNELTHWLKKGEAAEDHKYVRREWVNGEWRYYYDNDDKADKGFSLKYMPKTQVTETFVGTSGLKGTKKNSYYLNSQKVNKKTFDRTKTLGLYYKNESVSDIVSRNAKKTFSSASKNIDKGRSAISKLFKNAITSETKHEIYSAKTKFK